MKRQEGSVILLVLLVSAVFAVLAPVAGTLALSEARIARSHAVQTTALYIAEAGVELAIARLWEDSGFTGNFSGTLGGGSFDVVVNSETPGPGEAGRRSITATGRWGGGTQRVAAEVTFSQDYLQSFLFQHTFLSGDTSARINDSTITGPVRVGGFHSNGNERNTFRSLQGLQAQPVVDPQAGGRIPAVDFRHYVDLALDNRDQWYVVGDAIVGDANRVLSPDSNYAADLDAAVRAANDPNHRRDEPIKRILINAGDNKTVKLSLRGNDPPANFHGLIVIRANTVKFEDNINAYPNNNNPLVILTTGNIDIVPGHRVTTLGNSTLVYSSGTVSFTQSQGKNRIIGMNGIVVAKGESKQGKRDLWNANLTYNKAMLGLLAQDAQPDFRQMDVTYIKP